MNKQQQLTFDKGITNIPSDALCDDNELEVSENIVYRDGEHQPIQDPVKILPLTEGQLLFVHKPYGSSDKYIVQTYEGDIHWVTKHDDGSEEQLTSHNLLTSEFKNGQVKIEAIGNTLIIGDEKNSGFFKWGNGTYKALGKDLKEPKIIISDAGDTEAEIAATKLSDEVAYVIFEQRVAEEYIDANNQPQVTYEYRSKQINVINKNVWENTVVGLYSQIKNNLRAKGRFWAPFFVRTAVELYDGSYILHSAPILVFPSIRHNCFIYNEENWSDDGVNPIVQVGMGLSSVNVTLRAEYDYEELNDIVKGVTLFMSDQIELNTTTDLPLNPPDLAGQILIDGIHEYGARGTYYSVKYTDLWSNDGTAGKKGRFRPFIEKTDKEIKEALKEQTIFYKVAELGIKRNDENPVSFQTLITREKFKNLTTQEQLTDDYFSHCKQVGIDVDSYNNRLIYSGIKRTPYEGHKHFTTISKESSGALEVYVRMESQDGERTVKTTMWGPENLRYYFFYPDPQAKEVWAFDTKLNKCVWHYSLEEHPWLNGAYCFNGLPDENCNKFEQLVDMQPPAVNDSAVFLNQVMFSEVDNPFVFTKKGVVGFGTGELLALTTTTQALTMAAFGPQPLLAFTTKGVWSISIDKEGYPDSSDPISREVLIKDGPLCNTDGAVFFATKKGLMLIVGNDVRCVSEKLMGDFPRRLATSIIAYDYRDSLLWIVPKSAVNEESVTYCYVYNIKTGTFHTSKYFMPSGMEGHPDVHEFQDIIRTAFRRPIVIDGAYTDSECDPEYVITHNITGEWHPTICNYQDTKDVVFDNTSKRFVERHLVRYSIDGRNFFDVIRFYSDFDNDTDYVPGGNFKNKNNELYVWNSVSHELDLTHRPFTGIDKGINSSFIFDKTYNESEVAQDLADSMQSSIVVVREIYSIDTAIVFVTKAAKAQTSLNRFYLRCSVRCRLSTGVDSLLQLYYTDFAGAEMYVNQNDSGHPFGNLEYMTPDGASYLWDGSDFAESSLPFIGRVDLEFESSNTYTDEAALKDYFVHQKLNYDIALQGVVYDTHDERFYMMCYASNGEAVVGVYYLSEWDSFEKYVDSNNSDHPQQGTRYLCMGEGAFFLEWNGARSESPILNFDEAVAATSVVEDEYNENDLKDELLEDYIEEYGSDVHLLDLTLKDEGIFFDTRTSWFLQGILCTYFWQVEGSITLFYRKFAQVPGGPERNTAEYVDDTPGNEGYPLPYNRGNGNLYRLNKASYYRWKDSSFEFTFAGLSGVINSYPDTLFQKLGDGIYSLMERPQPTDDENTYNGVIMTRPMKLENALALKSIMQIRNVCKMDGTVVLSVWGSNNLRSWVKLRAFRNAPWKYYRFRFEFSNMPATDRFAGTVLITQERRTNKLR